MQRRPNTKKPNKTNAAAPIEQLYCAPVRDKVAEKDHTCYTRQELLDFIKAFNASLGVGGGERPDAKRITGVSRMSKGDMVRALDEKMTPVCGANQQWCWSEKLRDARVPVEAILRPVKPAEWKKDPYTWLSNFDIEKVMKQYEDDVRFRYKLMGVYPMDFAKVYPEVRATNIAALRQDGRDYLGYIINLDNHDESGSHWVSLLLCVNPEVPSYGAYFYDSVGTEPDKAIEEFLKDIVQPQCRSLYGRELPFYWNKRQNQHRNTECGIFSMNFQIKLLRKLMENPVLSVQRIAKINANDAKVHVLRDILFRPTTKADIDGGSKAKHHKERKVKEKAQRKS